LAGALAAAGALEAAGVLPGFVELLSGQPARLVTAAATTATAMTVVKGVFREIMRPKVARRSPRLKSQAIAGFTP
jgi:hypothetical protein